jgi:putative ABC transport system substrate-binding protein
MHRRQFCVTLASLCAAAAGEVLGADDPPLIALLRASSFTPDDSASRRLGRALQQLGHVPGKDIRIEQFSGRNRAERFAIIAEEAVKRKAAIIVVSSASAAQAARRATRTIPIVFVAYDQDPVAAGLADSLARPGGNATGVFSLQPQLVGKRFELLREILPDADTVAVLRDEAVEHMPEGLEAAASAVRLKLQHVGARWPDDLPGAFRSAREADATMVLFSSMFQANRGRLAQAALATRMPTICQQRAFVEAGALMSYAPDREAVLERVAYFIHRILNGARPAELPVEQAAKFELVVNARTAKALGVPLPASLLLRADAVIE